jgi:hypothetical protein
MVPATIRCTQSGSHAPRCPAPLNVRALSARSPTDTAFLVCHRRLRHLSSEGSGTHPISPRPTRAMLIAPLFRFQRSLAPSYTSPRTPTLSCNKASSSTHPCSVLPPPPSCFACDVRLVVARITDILLDELHVSKERSCADGRREVLVSSLQRMLCMRSFGNGRTLRWSSFARRGA